MSLATLTSPSENINLSAPGRKLDKYQLLEKYKHFPWKGKTHDLSKLIGIDGAKVPAVVAMIDPTQKTGKALYTRIKRLLDNLAELDLVKITGNWSYGDMLEQPGNGVQPSSILITLTNRMQNSNHFADQIPEGWKAVVNHYLPDENINAKSGPCKICTRDRRDRDPATVKKMSGPCFSCKRRDSDRDPAAVAKASSVSPCGTCAFWKNAVCTTTKRKCPYRLTVCCRAERKRAAWKLRGIDGREGKHHWMFVRKKLTSGKKVIQQALQDRLGSVQKNFTNYLDDVSKRVIILRRIDGGKGTFQKSSERRDLVEHLLPTGNELVLDYQTRFTDPGRSKEEIKKFHDTWREAGKNFDGAVFLTLTSDPASNDSLWDVNRHFAPAWNVYLQVLTKRFWAQRRDELIGITLGEIKRSDPDRWVVLDKARRKNREEVNQKLRALTGNCDSCTRKKGFYHQETIRKTRIEYQKAVFRIERRIRPWLGLTYQEKFDIRVKLETRTLENGEVVKESYRPVYLSVYEFMENGLLHAHITIFGTTWIDTMDRIKADWSRLGQGAMAHAYAMTKTPGSETWEWLGKPPTDSRNRQPVDYLVKYLVKGLYTKEGHGMYWCMNKRFFTRSQSLNSGWIDYSDGKTVWELLASLHEDQIPMSIKKQQRGSPLLKAWYDAYADTGPGPGVSA